MLDDATQAAVTRMVDKLKQQNCTISTCESLTAGLMAATIANLPGSSQVLRGGLITYATDLKVSVAVFPSLLWRNMVRSLGNALKLWQSELSDNFNRNGLFL